MDDVKQILADVLQLEDSAKEFSETTPLLGSIPEFDSMTVVYLISSLEEFYGFVIDDDEISADVFETVGSLVSFIEGKI